MTDDSSDGRDASAPGAKPSLGGTLLLLLACFPYALLVAALPHAGEFPNEGGGEARMNWEFQEFGANVACGATIILLWLALWRAGRSGGIARTARRAIPILVPAAGAAMFFAIAQGFEQPGPWLPLVPTLLPPAVGAYALWGCLSALSRWRPRAKIDAVAIGLIAALSLAVVPLAALEARSYPGRLERHRAELAAADADARTRGAQEEQATRARFARLGPGSSLQDYIEGQFWYVSGLDVVAGARQVKSRQGDAIAMLSEGKILDLDDLWRFDLEPTPALCEAFGGALAASFGRSQKFVGSALIDLIGAQFPNMQWLRDGHCDLDGPVAEIDAQLRYMLESKDPAGAAENDGAAYYSRWGVSRDVVEEMRAKLAGFRGAR